MRADEVIPTCRRLGIAIVPFSPLGRGFLTGTITSQSQFGCASSLLFNCLLQLCSS